MGLVWGRGVVGLGCDGLTNGFVSAYRIPCVGCVAYVTFRPSNHLLKVSTIPLFELRDVSTFLARLCLPLAWPDQSAACAAVGIRLYVLMHPVHVQLCPCEPRSHHRGVNFAHSYYFRHFCSSAPPCPNPTPVAVPFRYFYLFYEHYTMLSYICQALLYHVFLEGPWM